MRDWGVAIPVGVGKLGAWGQYPQPCAGLGLAPISKWAFRRGEPVVGLNRKASWRKEKIPRVLCFKPFW